MSKEQKKNDEQIDYYYKNNRFFSILFATKKYRDLWKSKEATVSFVLSLCVTTLLWYILLTNNYNPSVILEITRNVIPTLLGGFFSLLGLSIGGLAIITGTIEEDIITKIRDQGNIKTFISIVYNFYFCGALIGLSMLFSVIVFLITFIKLDFNPVFFWIISLMYNYMVLFSLIYSVMLLGTCIRIFLLRYRYMND